jgi:hypothetical protein
MGCFSYLCKECGKGILSNSFRGEKAKLFLLQDGCVTEEMEGEYDSYGRVFDKDMKSIEWEMAWGDICNLSFNDDVCDGIAAIHSKCWKGKVPATQSKGDPNQGWGEKGEFFGDVDPSREFDKQGEV